MRQNQLKALNDCRRIVVKVGTGLLADENGFRPEMIQKLAREIHFLKKANRQVILVSSGAVGAGREVLKRRSDYEPLAEPGLSRKQALAAIGQVHLISEYSRLFSDVGIHSAQLLFSARDFRDRRAYLNIGHTLNELLDLDVVPIINENDTVSTEELKFGDNDMLSAACAGLFHADCLIILTTVDGFLRDGKRIPFIELVDDEVLSFAGGPTGPGSGGMRTKMEAARLGQRVGHFTAILPGKQESPIRALLEGKDLGTLVPPFPESSARKLAARKKWILYVPGEGRLIVDDGARKALLEKGASLLSAGVQQCEGTFRQGDVVEILDNRDTVIARGLSSVPSESLQGLIGGHSNANSSVEVVHRDNLILDPHPRIRK
ncbi:MAG TPA: glutamate 5-kinase [Leptospiraceae bacterium]|nr:glutamate 5-kinase [Spirochaetaceae bacterium]HBS05746.1 glutamate 5-kinase [Leptospiraceae bacterium]|tara:strand:+ start:28321 stop:29448 length:1128 start_codon:yes stop_codon:yes gene_type:complete